MSISPILPNPVLDALDTTRVLPPSNPAPAPLPKAEFGIDPPSSQSLIIEDDLYNNAWWKSMSAGVVGNPHLKRIPAPITFKIMLNELSPSEYLPGSYSTSVPLELRLNCSLSQIQHKMKHVVNKANSRTGFHLTFWGLEPDTISGSGSTGVFMNHWGVTHLMSTNTDDYSGDVGLAFTRGQGNMFGFTRSDQAALEADIDSSVLPQLRVAAQDAFIELLSLFKNNGVVRFKNENYDGKFNQQTQLGDGVYGPIWTSQSGGTAFEQSMRNNDVMAKGQVIMVFQGNTYQGYFKTFSWTIDADSPFHWKFDFSFQIQRSLSFVYYNGGA